MRLQWVRVRRNGSGWMVRGDEGDGHGAVGRGARTASGHRIWKWQAYRRRSALLCVADVLILLAALGSLAIVTRSVRAMPTYWSLVNSTNLSYNGASLSAIAPVSANDIWAVGTFNTSTGPSIAQTLIEHWSGGGVEHRTQP